MRKSEYSYLQYHWWPIAFNVTTGLLIASIKVKSSSLAYNQPETRDKRPWVEIRTGACITSTIVQNFFGRSPCIRALRGSTLVCCRRCPWSNGKPAPSNIIMPTFLIRSATYQSTSYPIVLTRLGEPRCRSNPHLREVPEIEPATLWSVVSLADP